VAANSSVAAEGAVIGPRQTPPPRINEPRHSSESRGVQCDEYILGEAGFRLRFAPHQNDESTDIIGMIAGNGVYPRRIADAARKTGVKKIVAAAVYLKETRSGLAQQSI